MIKSKHVKNTIDGLEYFLFIMNITIAFRLLVLYINLNKFVDYKTGKMDFVGQNIKFFQTIVVKVTNPLISPFKGILISLMGQENSGFVEVLAPAFSIIVVLMIILVLKISSPYIERYIDRLENNR